MRELLTSVIEVAALAAITVGVWAVSEWGYAAIAAGASALVIAWRAA